MALNGKLQERLGTIIVTLVVTFILGGVGLTVSQAVANEKIEQLEKQQKINSEAAQALPVIKNDLGHIREALIEIKGQLERVTEDGREYHHKHDRGDR